MFEQLKDMIQQAAQKAVVENQAVPNEQNQAVIDEAHQHIQDSLQQMAQNGQLQDFAQKAKQAQQDIAQQPAAQQIQAGFIDKLKQKFGLSEDAAAGVASSLIPNIMNQVFGKNSQFDFKNIAQQFQDKLGGLKDQAANLGKKFGL